MEQKQDKIPRPFFFLRGGRWTFASSVHRDLDPQRFLQLTQSGAEHQRIPCVRGGSQQIPGPHEQSRPIKESMVQLKRSAAAWTLGGEPGAELGAHAV